MDRQTGLFTAAAFTRAGLLTRLFHQLLMARQAFPQLLQPLAQLFPVTGLVAELLAELLAQLLALLIGARSHFLFALTKLLLILLAHLRHALYRILYLTRQALLHAGAALLQVRTAGLEAILIALTDLVALLGASARTVRALRKRRAGRYQAGRNDAPCCLCHSFRFLALDGFYANCALGRAHASPACVKFFKKAGVFEGDEPPAAAHWALSPNCRNPRWVLAPRVMPQRLSW